MSELDWEKSPPIDASVPLVRDWFTPAFHAWTSLIYKRRGWLLIVWWPLLIPMVIYCFYKALFFWAVVALMVLAFIFWAAGELITYRWRRERALRLVWMRYMVDLHGEDGTPLEPA